MDVYYVDHVSFLMDWKIIFQTVLTVLKRDGINADNSATMEAFRGTTDSGAIEKVIRSNRKG